MTSRRITEGSGHNGIAEQVSFLLPPGSVMEQEPVAPRVQRRKTIEPLVTSLQKNHLLVLSSSAGYGATSISHEIARTLSTHAKPALYLRCDSMQGCLVEEMLASLVEIKDEQGNFPFSALCIEGIKRLRFDDGSLLNSFLKQLTSKTHVILRLDPASFAALEFAESATVVQAIDLLATTEELQRWFHQSDLRLSINAMETLTGGIPSLAEALVKDGVWTHTKNATGSYELKRSELLYSAIEDGIIKDDRRLRAAMILLGQGTIEDLRELGVRVDEDLVLSAYQEAPVLGVDSSLSAFKVVGAPFVPPAVSQRIGEEFPELAKRAIGKLMDKQQLPQVVSIAYPCRYWLDLRSLVENGPLDLWNAGGSNLLREALYDAEGQEEPPSEGMRVAQALLKLCSGVIDGNSITLREIIQITKDTVGPSLGILDQILKFYKMWPASGVSSEKTGTEKSSSGIQLAKQKNSCKVRDLQGQLEQHLMSRQQLLGGDWKGAAESRFWIMDPQITDTAVGSLLVMDTYVACCLLNEGVTLDLKIAIARALETLREYSGGRIGLYERSLCWFADVALGHQRDCGLIKDSWATATQSQDEAILDLLSLGGGLVHLQEGAMSQAEALLKPLLSKELPQWMMQARDLGLSLVALDCHEALTYLSSPETQAPTSPMEALSKVVATLFYETKEPLEKRVELKKMLARWRPDALSTLFVDLLLDTKAHRQTMRDLLPGFWRKAAEERRRVRRALSVASIEEGASAAEESSLRTISLHVLGGIQFKVEGQLVPKKHWRRSSASSLLECLALLETHSAYRYELFAWLWPDKTFERAKQCLYSAVSTARRALESVGADKNLLIHQGGMVALDSQYVSCDIDQLRLHINGALEAQGASECVAEALRASQLYHGGLFVPVQGAASEFFSREHDALEQRYLDALVRGAHKAREFQHPKDALQLSRAAHMLAPCREDACGEMVRALMDMRRYGEAELVCQELRVELRRRYRQSPGVTMNALANELARLRAVESGEGWTRPAGRQWEMGSLEEEVVEEREKASKKKKKK